MTAEPATRRTLFLCFVAAMLEGGDIVSMGLAAPSVAREFGFGPATLSYILTATIVGLMVGAGIGGRLGDRYGRKTMLLGAFVALGVFSLATTQAHDLTTFIAARLLCGLGLGAAFPNLIAIAAEASPATRRRTGVGLMFCGQPVGGTLFGLFVASQAGALDWRMIFVIGGVLPLLILPILWRFLPESAAFRAAAEETGARPPAGAVLFGEGRTTATLLLWVSYAFTQIIVYVINNWLPTLMVGRGFTPAQAGMISAFENAGAAAGCVVLAVLADRMAVGRVLLISYAAIAVSLGLLGVVEGLVPTILVGIVVGFFAIGGQLVLYAVAPDVYPVIGRATGVGAAVSFGRFGAIAGPLLAGGLLASGYAAGTVLLAAAPCALVAGAAAVGLARRIRG